MTPKTIAPSDVAIITVSYNSSAQLADFLDAAIKTIESSHQIIIADNNSSDIAITRNICSKYGVRLLELDNNYGYGSALNKAVHSLVNEEEILVVCNPDTILNQKVVLALRDSLIKDKMIGAIGPRIIDVLGNVYPSARNFPTVSVGIGHALFGKIIPNNPWTLKYHTKSHLSENKVETGWVSGACMAIRKSTFLEINGFDENFFMYFEDVDICFRLFCNGYKNIYLPSSSVIHKGGESTKSVPGKMKSIHHESAKKYIQKIYPGKKYFLMRLLINIGLFIRERISLYTK